MTAESLKDWRQRMSFSLIRASEALGCSKTSLIKWERDGGAPRYIALACSAISHGLPPMGG
jgi:transcriptional regulator with XRE-family HTH domain